MCAAPAAVDVSGMTQFYAVLMAMMRVMTMMIMMTMMMMMMMMMVMMTTTTTTMIASVGECDTIQCVGDFKERGGGGQGGGEGGGDMDRQSLNEIPLVI